MTGDGLFFNLEGGALLEYILLLIGHNLSTGEYENVIIMHGNIILTIFLCKCFEIKIYLSKTSLVSNG